MIFLEEDKIQEVMIGPFVDYEDGVTPETGITWGSANIEMSKLVGVVPTSTALTDHGGSGVNEITELQDGYYRIKLTTTNLSTPGVGYLTFRDDDVFLPVMHSFMVLKANVFQWFVLGTSVESNLTSILGRIGAFAGSGVNTVKGFLDALGSKTAALPSEFTGGFSAADSTEAIRDKLDKSLGSVSTSDLKSAINASSPRTSATTTSTTSSGDLAVRTSGFLDRLFRIIRKATDSPATNRKYQNSDLLDLANMSWAQIWADLKLTSDNQPLIRLDMAINATDLVYELPANMGELKRFAKIDSETDLVEWEIIPRARYNPSGPAIRIEGNTLRLGQRWTAGHTLRLEYVPDGEAMFHEGKGGRRVDSDGNYTLLTPTLGEAVGTVDRRQNAYAGCLLRVWDNLPEASGVEERFITASAKDTVQFTVSPAFSRTRTTAVNYEVIPLMGRLFENVLGLNVARRIMANESNKDAFVLLTQQYREDLRAIRLKLMNMMARRPDRMEGDVVSNSRYGRPIHSWR